MSKLTDKDVRHVAKLSNLSLNETEIKKFSDQLGEIISYVENLQDVNTEDCEPTNQTTGLVNIYRGDKIDPTKSLTVDDAVSQSSKVKNNLFEVPMILTERSDK